jgi:RNA polymerase sigma-70 factor (ECF subfamily)
MSHATVPDLDHGLVERCLAGDNAAWEQVVRLHSRRVYNLCLRFTGRPQEAEDLSQEVFLRLYRNMGQYRAESGNFTTWLTALTRNLLIDHYRRSRNDRRTDALEDAVVDVPAPSGGVNLDRMVWGREAHEHIQRALCRLSPELREVVILRDLQEMDYKSIAAALGVPEGTVKSRINRGRLELARLLRSTFGAAAPASGTAAPGVRP